MVINVPTGQLFAGGEARGQIASQQLGLQGRTASVQEGSLELAQQKQQDLQIKQIGDQARANFKALEEELGGISEQLEILRAQPESTQRDESINSLLQAAGTISSKTVENLDLTAASTGTSFDFEKARIQRLFSNLKSPTVSAKEKAEFAGKVSGTGTGTAKVTEAAVTGVPLVAPKAPNVQNFIQEGTGQRISIDVNAPGASQQVAQLTGQGFFKVSTTEAGTPAEFAALAKKEPQEFRKTELASRNALSTLDRVNEIIQSGDFVSGLTGAVIQTLKSVEGNIRQAVKATGGEIEGNPFDSSKYDLSGFGEFAATSQAFKTNIVGLAIQLAHAAEPGGKLSDKDVQLQLNRLAANSGDPNQIRAALAEVERNILVNLENFGTTLKLSPEQFPQDLAARLTEIGASETPPLNPSDITFMLKRKQELEAKAAQ